MRIYTLILLSVLLSFNIEIAYARKIQTEKDSIITVFYKEVELGNLDKVKIYINNKDVDIKYLNENYNPYWLMANAAMTENEELVDFLISNGGDVKLADSSGETALLWVAWKGNLRVSQILVDRGADLNAYYNANGGLTPLICAAESGNLDLVKYLITKGADPLFTDSKTSSSPLRGAAYRGRYDVFLHLAKLQTMKYDWQQALFFGITGGNLDIVKYTIEEKGADVNKKIAYWKFPIEEAAREKITNTKVLEMLKYLESKGAKLSDINGGQVFPWAMKNCSEEVIAYLIESGFEPTMGDLPRDWEPLPAALDRGYFTYAQYLVDRDTDKDLRFRGVPLMFFFINSPRIIEFLIKNGINKDYYSSAFLDAIAGESASADLLLKAGADVNYTESNGRNALFYIKNKQTGHYLVDKGIDVNNLQNIKDAANNYNLLQLFDDLNINIPLSDSIINNGLLKSAQLGDSVMVEYFLKRKADVNSIAQKELVDRYECYFSEGFPVVGQTALSLNAIYGYSRCAYSFKDEKIQVDPQIAKMLIDAGSDVNYQDSFGNTALHYTAMNQWCRVSLGPIPMGGMMDRESGSHADPAVPPLQHHDLIMQELIKEKANVNLQNKEGDTPLLIAAKSKNSEAIAILLKAEVDIDVKNNEGGVFLDYINDLKSLIVLKETGFLKKIKKEKFNQIFCETYYEDARNYNSPLQENLEELIDLGANVNSLFGDSTTVLIKLVKDGFSVNIGLLESLIKKGANVNAKDKEGKSVLLYALENIYNENLLQTVQVLLNNGADAKIKDKNENSTLIYTLNNSKNKMLKETIQTLVSKGTDINATNSYHISAYTVANVKGKKEIAEMLLELGAKRDVTNEWWYALTELYVDDSFLYLKSLMQEEGVDVNIATTYLMKPNSSHGIKTIGTTALMYYSSFGKINIMQELIALGADVNMKDGEGKTAFDYAKYSEEARKLLIDAGYNNVGK